MRLPIAIPLVARNVTVAGPRGLGKLAGIRGLLGLSFLRHFRTAIDYRQGYLEIS